MSLKALAHFAASRMASFPAFCAWLGDLAATEFLRRQGELPQGDDNHYLPPWDDAQLADALEGATLLSYAENVTADTGKLIDKIVIHVNALAANRLRHGHDLRRMVKGN